MLNWNTTVNYSALLFQVIANVEGVKPRAYLDTKGIPTIGIGFNLRIPSVFDAVMASLSINKGDPAYGMIQSLVRQPWSGAASLDAALDAVMATRAQSSNGAISLTTFTLTQTQMQQVFNTVVSTIFEPIVDSKVPGVPDSAERAALISLAFNNPSLIGNNLISAINSSNRAAAWFEIRYNSNLNGGPGGAKRRYYESQVFGLFDANNPNPDSEYKNAFAVYTLNETDIKNYDQLYGGMVLQANRSYQGANVQATTMSDGNGGLIEALNGVFAPAAKYLIQNYAANQQIQQIFSASSDTVTGINLVVNRSQDKTNNLIFGNDGNDTLTAGAGKSYLYGGNGNNTLVAYSGTNANQIDILVGGSGGSLRQSTGSDSFVAGSGDDLMIGDDASSSFTVNTNENSQNFNIIWGDNKSDTYNFTGNSIVYLANIADPTLQSVEQYASSVANFNSFFQTVTGFLPGQVGQGQAETIIINPNPSDTIVANGNTLTASQYIGAVARPGSTATFVVGDNETFSPTGNSSFVAEVGSGDSITTSSIGPQQTGSQIRVATGSSGSPDTLAASTASTIMIGNGVDTTFNISAAADTQAIDVVWGQGGSDTIDITGNTSVFVINAPNATLASVENLDLQKLSQQIYKEEGLLDPINHAVVNVFPPSTDGANVFVINPTSSDKLVVNGQTLTGDISNSVSFAQAILPSQLGGFGGEGDLPATIDYNLVQGGEGRGPGFEQLEWIVGLSYGDFGITNAVPSDEGPTELLQNGTPTVNLVDFQTQASAIANGGPGGGPDPGVIDQASVNFAGVSDTLLSIGAATATGFNDTLVAANGADTLTASGNEETLFGNGAGSTLINNGGFGDVAVYAIDNVTVRLDDFGNGSAKIDGSSISDTLVGTTVVEALGTNDTLIGLNNDTLIALAAGNTLIGEGDETTLIGTGVGTTLIADESNSTALYQSDNAVLNLAAGTAVVSGGMSSDALIGIHNAVVSGQNSIIIGNDGDTLTASGGNETLIAGSGVESLVATGGNDILIGSTDTGYLSSSGFGNTLIAGTGAETLSSTGFEDTLIGNGAGSQLITSNGGVAAYTIDNVVVDLVTNLATIRGATVSDTLQNITAADAIGDHDTLLAGLGETTLTAEGSHNLLEGGSGTTTLISNGNSNTLTTGSGLTTAAYSIDEMTVDLGTGTAAVNGSSANDSLIGINNATVSGAHDTLIGGSVGDVLVASGINDTLIAGSGAETLSSNFGSGNTLIAGSGSDTLSSNGTSDVLLAGDGSSETLSSNGSSNTLIAGGGSDTLSTSGTSDTLVGGAGASLLLSSGSSDSLMAGTGFTTLVTTGVNDTLFGNGGGSTLDGTAGTGAVVAFAGDNVTINLAAGSAGINGSGTVDTLLGFTTVAALGSNDTVTDGNGGSTLFSDAAGNTLIGGAGETIAAYSANDLSVDLSLGTAGVNGSGITDSLIGIAAAAVSGSSDSIIADNGTDVLSSSGSGNTLIAGSGTDTLTTSGTGDTLLGGVGADTLTAAGSNGLLLGGAGPNVLNSTGSNDTLIAGESASTLLSSGSGDILFGNAAGSTLDATVGVGATAAYALADLTIDVAAGTATVDGADLSDTLSGFDTFAVLGSNDTIVDDDTGSTLFSSASGNTLEGGAGETVAAYAGSGLTINLTDGTVGMNGSGLSDTLIGIHAALASGSNDILLGDAASDFLSSTGSGNTLVAGTGVDTLFTAGTGDTLYGNLLGSTLEEEGSLGNAVAIYTQSDATIDMTEGTAQLDGASVSDQIVGFTTIQVLGSNDTLVGDGSSLISDAAGNTLVGGGNAVSTAVYEADDVTVNLVVGTATVNGTNVADTLTNILAATVTGENDTLISAGTGNTLTAANASDILVYAIDNISVDLLAGTAGVNGTNAEDQLVNIVNVRVSGDNDSVSGGMVSGTITAAGGNDVLVSGDVGGVLIASGSDDTLVGNLAGSILTAASGATGTVALYTNDGVTVDLSSGIAFAPISSAVDTLAGITEVSTTGSFNTLIAGSGADTLSSSGAFNSLVGGAGADLLISNGQDDALIGGSGSQTLVSNGEGNTLIAGTAIDTLIGTGQDDVLIGNALGSTLVGVVGAVAAYGIDNVAVNLASGTAQVSGSSVSDTLSGITSATLAGSNDTAVAAASGSVLSASGLDDTLIGGSGADTLSTSGSGDTLLAGNGNAVLSSSGASNSLVAGSGLDVLSSSGIDDFLEGGSGADTLSSGGSGNTLEAGTGADILTSTGSGDTLFGNGAGSTLIGTGGTGVVAVYTMDNVTVDLVTDTATVNGSSTSDTLVGIGSVMLLGSNDTITGGAGPTTLYSNANGNTLIGGTGRTTAVYAQDDVTVDLATSQATVSGSVTNDTLIGISSAQVSGNGDTLVGGAGGDVLSSTGTFNTLIAGSGTDTLSSNGIGDTLIGGSGADVLLSTGQANVLMAGSVATSLVSMGFGDTLIGNTAGSTLDGSAGFGAIADYSTGDVTVNLASSTATVNGSGVSDTLLGISAAMASGTNDTLIGGGAGATTLFSNGDGNTLVAGTGETTAAYLQDSVIVNLATLSAAISGSNTADALIGVTNALVGGFDDTLIGSSGGDVLSSNGFNNTLIAGAGVETLSSSGSGDTLLGNAAGSTLDGSSGDAAIAAYEQDNVTVDLTTGTASINGAGVADTLIGVIGAEALGSGDTLIGGANATTLYGDGAGSTLIAGVGETTAAYAQDNVTVNLATASAAFAGSSVSDTLVGIASAMVSGADDVVIGGGGVENLSSDGTSNTLIAGSGIDSLSSGGIGDTLIGRTAGDLLSSGGFDNSLVAGSGAETLVSAGEEDTLFGNANGSTLDGSGGFGAVAAYTTDNTTIDLSAGTAAINGATAADTLIGIESATVSGIGDTLIGGPGSDTLGASGNNDVVFAGSGTDTLVVNSGTNTFVAGWGINTFVIQSAAIDSRINQPQNLIDSFSATDDTIDLTQIDGVGSFADLSFSTVTFGSQSYLQIMLGSTGQAIMLSGISQSDLTASNFLFAEASGSTLTVTITSAAEEGNIANQLITGTVVASGAGVVAGETVTLIDNGATIGAATVLSDGTFSADVTLPNQGSNPIVATVTDSAGNTGFSTAVVDTLDDIAPVITFTSTSEASNVASQVVTGAVASGGAATVAGQTVTLTVNGTTVGTTIVKADGTFSITVTLSNQGSNSIVATVTDSFGNIGSSTAIVDTLDNVAPTVTITSAAEASKAASQTVSGIVMSGGAAIVAGQTVTLTVNGAAVGTTVVQSDGTFSTTVTLPDQGSNSIVATVTDSFGNTGTSAAVVETLDDVAPTVTITSAAEASKNASQTIVGTVVSGGAATVVGQAVTLTDNGATLGTAIVQSNGTFSANVTLPNQGSNSIVATLSDSFGNIGSSTAVIDTLGSVAPTITGTKSGETTTSQAPIDPFSGVTIGDQNTGAADTLTITLRGGGGVLSGAGLTGSGFVYRLSGTATNITTELDALVFTPTAGQPNTRNTTAFTLSDVSTGYTETYASMPTVLTSFNNTDGQFPVAGLISDSAGDLFGTTASGGASNDGTVFEIVKSGSTFSSTPTVLTSFANNAAGDGPQARLTMDAAGDLFGVASGGANSDGTVFEIIKSGSGYSSTPTAIASFNGTNGTDPDGTLLIDSAGDLFGTTQLGGANNDGDVFEITKSGGTYSTTPTVIASFGSANGQFSISSLIMDSAGDLFGTIATGGASNDGTVFEIVKSGGNYSSTPVVLASFNRTDGATPGDDMIMDAAGDLFGTTFSGGANNKGEVFEIVKTSSGYASTPTVIASFNGTNGLNPQAGLIMDAAGDLFGITKQGGANGIGTVFEITNSNAGYSSTPTLLTSFDGTNGEFPQNVTLTMDASGDLFGTTGNGGANSDGVVFELAAVGQTQIVTIDANTAVINTDPAVPPNVTITSAAETSKNATQTIAGTVTSPDATVAGQTVTLKDNGTALATAIVQSNGSFSANVTLPNQGSNSIVVTVTDSIGVTGTSAALIDTLEVPPTITGTRAGQATTSEGRVDPFSGVTVGDLNNGATDTLTIALSGSGGSLTGTGLSGSGNTYTLAGTAPTITSELDALVFTPTAGQPDTSGTTSFKLADASTGYMAPYASPPTVVASFNGTNGENPTGSLITDSAGDLFGTATEGTGTGSTGTVFEITKSGSSYSSTPTLLASLNAADGADPQGSLIIDSSGDLFGTTASGGANRDGTVFEITKSGSSYSSTPTVLASFNGADGLSPEGNLIADSAGDLFGTTFDGGANNDGTVFEITRSGSSYSSTPTVLVSFNGTDGGILKGSLIMDSAGDLFGTTFNGGANNDGTVFEITKSGSSYSSTPTVLTSFNGTDGSSLTSSLIMDSAGDLFGTTSSGGANGDGTVFEITKSGSSYNSTPTVLASFNGTNGSGPRGSLITDSAGDLFGTTSSGGANGDGTMFEITKSGSSYSSTPTVLASFNGTDGEILDGSLIMDAAGDLLGTTVFGGANNDGTVVELAASPTSVPTVNTTTTVINSDPPVAPTVTITSAAEASKTASQTIIGTVTSPDATVAGRTITLTDNGATLGTTTIQSNGGFSASVTLPNQGSNSIVATVTDSLGLTGTSAAVADTLDSIAPALAITSVLVPGNTTAQTVTGSVASGGAATVAGRNVTLTDNGSPLGTATVQSNGAFSAPVTLPSQANNEILASVSDSYGNTNNSYLATAGSGQIAITAQQGAGIANDLDFTGAITDQNLWFLQSGNNLQIDIVGNTSSVTVNNWFSDTNPDQLQEITAGGSKIDSQVSQLVQAMATYSSNNPGFNPASSGTSMPNDANLQSAIAAAWHS